MRVLRTIIEDSVYTREIQGLVADVRLADSILRDVMTIVAYEPDRGQVTDNQSVRAVPVKATPVSPALVIYYTFDAESVTLRSVRGAGQL